MGWLYDGEKISCPKCGEMCKTKGIGFLGYLAYCAAIILTPFTFGVTLVIAIIVYFLLKSNAKSKSVECPKCGFSFIP